MLKKAPNFVLGRSDPSTDFESTPRGPRSTAALLDDLFEHPGAGRAWVFLLLLLAASGFGGCAGSPARHAGDAVGYVERRGAARCGPGVHGHPSAHRGQYGL